MAGQRTAEAVFRVCHACFAALQEGIPRITHAPCVTEWCDCCHGVLIGGVKLVDSTPSPVDGGGV